MRKRGYRLLHPARGVTPPAVVLILGCQRSGTSILLELFTEDMRSVTFPERSVLSRPDEDHLRLKPVAEVNRHLNRLPAPLFVLKPLVESQNAPALLAGLEGSFAVWMHRRYEAVAASDLNYFGFHNGERNLRLLLSNDPPNWRGEVVPETTRSVLSAHYRPDMSPFDAAALFWWARTSLYFDLGLDGRSDVMLCSYEHLIADPKQTMRALYSFVGVDYPAREITQGVHRGAADRGSEAEISPEVRRLCEELEERLEAATAART